MRENEPKHSGRSAQVWWRWPLVWWGAAAGLLMGFLDALVLRSIGIVMKVGAYHVNVWVGLFFACSFGLFGGALGALQVMRRRWQEQAETIQSQATLLQRTQAAAAENEKLAAIGRLAACVAHEVRNPLGVIRTSASLLMEEFPEGDENRRAGAFICEEVERLDVFCRALLDFSRPLSVQPKAIQPTLLLEQVAHIIRDQHPNATLSLRVLSKWEGGSLLADAMLLQQVLLSLLQNSVQAVEDAGVLELRIGQEPGHCWIEVADDGPGVGSEQQEKLFEPFFTTKATGTGLGLAMATRVIEAHGGSISSVVGQGAGPDGEGACFRLTLPLTQMSPQEEAP